MKLFYYQRQDEVTNFGDYLNLWLKISIAQQKLIATQLMYIAQNTRPNLSTEQRIEQLTVALEERLHEFKADLAWLK